MISKILIKTRNVKVYFHQAKRITQGFDILKYIYICYHNKLFNNLVFGIKIKINQIGNKKVLIRTSTIDLETLQSTFINKYHIPPFELPSNPIILDLGCNVGYTILHYASLNSRSSTNFTK